MPETISLLLHIAAGYTALTSGTLIMIFRKATATHVRIGRVFFASMLLVSLSALVLSLLKDRDFLLHVGIFVLYQVVAGWRSVRDRSLRPKAVDLLLLTAALANAVAMLRTGHIVLIVFAGISFLLVGQDLLWYYFHMKKGRPVGLRWLSRHLGMMIGAFIGTVTAFLTVNIQWEGPIWILWLGPTFVLVPLMQYWDWKYVRKRALRRGA